MGDTDSPPSSGTGKAIAGAVVETPGQEVEAERAEFPRTEETPALGGQATPRAAATKDVPPKAEPGRKAMKREKILKAAMELFATSDYQSVLMSEVARAAGVGKGTLYRYFKTKDDLFVQSVLWATRRAVDHLRAHLEERPETEVQIREVIWHTMKFFRENDSLFHILHHNKVEHSCEQHEEIRRKRDELRGLIEGVIERGTRRGVFWEVESHFAASVLWGMIRSSMHWYRDQDPGEMADRLSRLFLEGVKS